MNDTKKSNWLYFYYAGFAVLLFVLAGVNSFFDVMPERVSMALVSLGIAVVLFGIFDSVAKVAVGEESKLGKTFSLGGAAAGFFVVFNLLEPTTLSIADNPQPVVNDVAVFDVIFTAPLNKEPAIEHFSDLELRVTQTEPASTYQNYPLLPTESIGRKIGQYELKERSLKHIGDQYQALFKRKVLDSFVGMPGDIPKFNICFIRAAPGPISAKFACDGTSCKLDELSKNIKGCDAPQTHLDWRLFGQAYASAVFASSTAIGWITPSLDTLKENYQQQRNTYVEFVVAAEKLLLPETVDAYSYQLTVNEQPVFINGWTEAETISTLDPNQPFQLSFGLQNLDFSGADFGQENLQLTLTFYAAGEKIRTDIINRNYIALRTVQPFSTVENDVHYRWSGQQYFGLSDGFEVFIWSSTNAEEIVQRRKKFFDEANLTYQGGKVVAVVRPPLSNNKNYGLVLGLVDGAGRIDFTFPKATATEIATWLRTDVAPLKTAVRPETNRQHPLIKDVNLYQIGH